MKEEFQVSDFKKEVIEELKGEDYVRSNISMARSILRKISESLDKPLDPDEPTEMRDKIFRFYENQDDYESIDSMHVSPMKKLLEKAADNTEERSAKRNITMVKDTLDNLKNRENIIEQLNKKILEEDEKERILEDFNGEKKFALKLCLESSAKIGALAAIEDKQFKEGKNKILLKSQYKQDGERELGKDRHRRLEISDSLCKLYRKEIENKNRDYLFGNSLKGSYHNLRELLDSVDEEHDGSRISSSVLRDTSGYFKSLKMDSSELKREMGLKTDIKIKRFRKVREMREN